jgi:hypothetical protein
MNKSGIKRNFSQKHFTPDPIACRDNDFELKPSEMSIMAVGTISVPQHFDNIFSLPPDKAPSQTNHNLRAWVAFPCPLITSFLFPAQASRISTTKSPLTHNISFFFAPLR